MPLVPLYDELATTASHNVRAPGGFETWRLRAFDSKQNLFLHASLWHGYLFHPQYLKQYRRYLRHPTRMAPPIPQDYAAQELALFQNGRLISSSLTPLPPSQSFPTVSPAGLHFSLGDCQLALQPRQSNRLDITTLTSSHHWLFTNPLATLRGKLQLAAGSFSIDALACHEQRYGSSPIDAGQWLEGCVFFPQSVICFQATPTTSWIIHITSDAAEIVDQPLAWSQPKRGWFFLDYPHPRSITLADRATLTNPHILNSSPARVRLTYEAKSEGESESGHGLVELCSPARLHRPLTSFFLPRPRCDVPPITWSAALPPGDKSSPSLPAHAPAPSSSP